MKISITAPSRDKNPKDNSLYDLILQQDNWNDFSFVTLYHLYATSKHSKTGDIEYIGGVKIIKKGQSENDYHLIKIGESGDLDNSFCSVGTGLDYYNRIASLNEKSRVEILSAMRDFNVINYIEEGFTNEPAWIKSIMRDLSEDDDIFHLPKFILENNYDSIPSVDLSFSFKNTSMINELSFDFDSNKYGYDESHKLPDRMSVIVGRNGSGKSTALARLSRVAYSSTLDRKGETLKKVGVINPSGMGFPKIINLSYSAFDSFQIPGITYKEKIQLKKDIKDGKGRYIYCGIRDICQELENSLSSAMITEELNEKEILLDRHEGTILKPLQTLTHEFSTILDKIHGEPQKKKNFIQALNILKAEPSLHDIINEVLSPDFIVKSYSYFKDLSTGHKFVLHSICHIVFHAEKRSLIMFDEPETHLHPPLLAALMSAIRFILNEKDAFAIIATHSPVVVQETLSKNVNIIYRNGEIQSFQKPEIETFGENIGLITSTVFSLTTQVTDYHADLDRLVEYYQSPFGEKNKVLESIEKCFDKGLSMQARAYVMSKLVSKE